MTDTGYDAAHIAELNAGIERYNPNHINELVDYLDYQISSNSYDKDANLALLKLVQFGLENDTAEQAYSYRFGTAPTTDVIAEYDNVWKVYKDIVYKILLKALMQMPRTDFSLMKAMINYDIQQNEELIGWSIYIFSLLDCCHFEKFWQEIGAVPDRISEFTGFYDSIRQYICYSIGVTFQHVDKEYAMKLLGVTSEADLQKWSDKQGWEMKGHDIFCGSQSDKVKTKNITEKLGLDTVGMHEVLAFGVTERGLTDQEV